MQVLEYSEALISEKPVIVRRRVLWGECDPAGVVYTPRFSDYVLSARDWFLRKGAGLLDRPDPANPGIGYPTRAMSFDFSSRLKADDLFDMRVRMERITQRTFTLGVYATHVPQDGGTGAPAFTAQLTAVCVDGISGESVPLPAGLRESLERCLRDQ